MKSAKAIFAVVFGWVLLEVVLDFVVPDRVMNVLFIVLMSAVLTGVALVAYGTIAKNRWGLNVQKVNCPRCGQPMPVKREPVSRNQRLWGGWTCTTCGCDMDKWGRESFSTTPIGKPPYQG